MSDGKEADIRVAVDLTNPGQFFACCGLLELADRVDASATGAFRGQGFVLHAQSGDFLEAFFKSEIAEVLIREALTDVESDNEGEGDDGELNPLRHRIAPMRLLEPFNMRLDWWNQEQAREQKLKTWTAGQRVTDLMMSHRKRLKRKNKPPVIEHVPSMRQHFASAVKAHPNDWLRTQMPIEAPAAFSYDSRLSRNNALDLGHTDSGVLAFSPAVDVLTLIAFQRFRPLMVDQWSRNRYCTWCEPLPAEIAAAVALGIIPHLIDNCFEFPIKRRDSQGRFKLFGHAHPIRRPYV